MRGLERDVHEVLYRRLAPQARAPLALGLSGGGDSTALLLIAADWARARGRKLVVLTVDHRLNPASGGWTAACAALAARLGLPFEVLPWEGDKPAAGLPAAARAARHRLLADAARAHGARVILLGHTGGDLAEAQAMRAAGSTTPSPREWAPSPAWPQGRGVFLLRPMLRASRQQIRDWLAARGEAWIDDPANDDLRYARARARLAGAPPAPAPGPVAAELTALARSARVDAAGTITTPRRGLPPAFIAIAALCASGATRPPRADRLARIAALLEQDAPFVATLAGARIEARGDEAQFMREPGEIARRGLPPLSLEAGQTGVWDGRFEIAAQSAMRVVALAGRARNLSPAEAAGLRGLAPPARAALPTIDGAGLAQGRCLVAGRLLAACGAIDREPL